METGMVITVYLMSALVAAVVASIAAHGRSRHPGYWMIFSFLFPPTVLLLLILPKGHGQYERGRDPFRDRDDRDDLL
jgi:hypothetical protein